MGDTIYTMGCSHSRMKSSNTRQRLATSGHLLVFYSTTKRVAFWKMAEMAKGRLSRRDSRAGGSHRSVSVDLASMSDPETSHAESVSGICYHEYQKPCLEPRRASEENRNVLG